ncbi:RAD51-associated protein 1 isoform X1 [Centroberyx affinis]|uniref:RAD51-associated protein 1 isoform X1 n=1 Tax=Centroberyx affinis TaxID=166261 RepID=UPI003A5C4265
MDRPSRKTKVVNYCDSQDLNDDDEDFACVKAPPSKKAREDVKQQERKKSSSKSSSQETDSLSTVSQKSRKPLDEKLYARDLEAALTLSLLHAADGKEDQFPIIKEDVKDQLPVDENTDPSSLRISNCSVNITDLGLDRITESPCAPSRQRKAASCEQQRSKLKDEDDDYQPKATPDSESDEDFSEQGESEDEEFTVKKVKKTTKKEKRAKNEKTRQPLVPKKEKQTPKPSKAKPQATAASTPVIRPPPAKLTSEPRRPAASTAATSKPAVSLSPAGGRIPKWTPPGQVGRSPGSSQGAVVKSPGQGLRLGLSRLVRVKPLHPSVASH